MPIVSVTVSVFHLEAFSSNKRNTDSLSGRENNLITDVFVLTHTVRGCDRQLDGQAHAHQCTPPAPHYTRKAAPRGKKIFRRERQDDDKIARNACSLLCASVDCTQQRCTPRSPIYQHICIYCISDRRVVTTSAPTHGSALTCKSNFYLVMYKILVMPMRFRAGNVLCSGAARIL